MRGGSTGHEMNAIILAAGKGARLNGSAGDAPKCLASIGAMTLLERQIRALRDAGLRDITVVVGCQADRVRRAGKRLLLIRPTGSELEKHGFNFLSNRGNDVIEQAAYDATMAVLTSDRLRVLFGRVAA